MAQNSAVKFQVRSSSNATVGEIILNPSRARNGVYEYSGRVVTDNAGTVVPESFYDILNTVDSRFSASVRQGSQADPISGKQRVKRRLTAKCSLPISLVSPIAGGQPTVDYITVDFVLSAPVGASEEAIKTALVAANIAVNLGPLTAASPVIDMLVNGNEPF